MRWLLSVLALASSSTAVASERPYCGALMELKEEARKTGTPQRISIYKVEEFTFQDEFCSAALPIVGLEFTHKFPWSIFSCLSEQGMKPRTKTVYQYTGIRGRKKLNHLWATWDDGTHIDIRFEPLGDFSDDSEFRDYWGVYRMVIWQPQ